MKRVLNFMRNFKLAHILVPFIKGFTKVCYCSKSTKCRTTSIQTAGQKGRCPGPDVVNIIRGTKCSRVRLRYDEQMKSTINKLTVTLSHVIMLRHKTFINSASSPWKRLKVAVDLKVNKRCPKGTNLMKWY